MFGKVISMAENIAKSKCLSIGLNTNRLRDKLRLAAVPDKLNRNFYSSNAGENDDAAAVKERQIKLIKTEIALLDERGARVPQIEHISPKEWIELLAMEDKKRRKYYSTLFRKQCIINNEKMKKVIRRAQGEDRKREYNEIIDANKHINYGIGKNSLFMRIRPQTMKQWQHNKIWRSLLHTDSQLIFDCGFENDMTPKEMGFLVKQLEMCHSINRTHSNPFFFNLTRLQPNGKLYNMLLRVMPTLHSKSFPIRVMEQFIPDRIAKERLVYLTPNSNTPLTEFNDNDVYIIGALYDRSTNKPLTLAKAKSLELRTARLPLERFVECKGLSKTLTIDQMTKIMLEFKRTGDLRQALQPAQIDPV